MIQGLAVLNNGATTAFKGGAGINTLELFAGPGASGPIVAKVLMDGSVSFAMNGRTIVTGADAERFVVSGSGFGDPLIGSAGNDWLDGGQHVHRLGGKQPHYRRARRTVYTARAATTC